MRLEKCWLSAGLTASLLFALLAKVETIETSTDKITQEDPKPNVSNFPENTQTVEQHQSEIKEVNSGINASIFSKDTPNAERHQFGAEVSRLLKILANSVYTDKRAVVRELLSNAIDAIEKQHDRQLAKADSAGLDDIANYKVVVEVDKENSILSFTDNGIGMAHDELKEFLGTIAKSGTAEFSSEAKKGDPANMIGQFGVGFYSVLLVAEKVAVISKSDQDPKQWIWETDASASFRISEDLNGPTLGRGTRVMLKVKSDANEFLDHNKLEKIMKEYFGYDRHRIYLVKPKMIEVEEEETKKEEKKENGNDAVEVEDEKGAKSKKKVEKTVLDEVLISQNTKPIWQRNPSEVKEEEYEALYKTITGDKYGKPIAYTHFSGETAKSESFRAVLFIPERPPFSPFSQKDEQILDLKLHVRGVFVTAKFEEFIPRYLSFVKGIIDSDDISLNISREILQNTNELRGIRKKVVKKIIEMMTDLAASSGEKHKKFYDSYSSFIKMEVAEHDDYRSLLSKLLRYQSTKSGDKMKSLDEYVEGMPASQKERKVIYYLASQPDEIENSPFLGRFRDKDYEVLLMTEPVDEHMIQRLEKYDDYKFENVAKDGVKLDEEDEKMSKEYEEKYKSAKEWVSKALKESVEKVILVPGPVKVPGAVKSSQYGWTGNMERLVMAQSSVKDDPMLQFFAKQKKILELNPKNAVIAHILDKANSQPDSELKVTLKTLVDAMMVWSGYSVKNPSSFASGIDRMTRKILNLPTEPVPEEKDEVEGDKKKESDSEEDFSVHDAERIEKANAEANEGTTNKKEESAEIKTEKAINKEIDETKEKEEL